ncbi:hypothetical protein GGR56DRAFT_650170 [Xylariaceae sp. FL0804]|nr:hypothetical protein GGR56DRAFT_650170 [Xylariaceae sp. FL0804]
MAGGLREALGPMSCGFCGVTQGSLPSAESEWATYYRALYCTDLDGPPRLSGVGYRHRLPPVIVVPPAADQRVAAPGFDDTLVHFGATRAASADPARLMALWRDVPPASGSAPGPGAAKWHFQFHDACWRLLEQACAPAAVDLAALWRLVISWRHASNYRNPYKNLSHTTAHVSSWMHIPQREDVLAPTKLSDPFGVPEIQAALAKSRTRSTGTDGGWTKPPHVSPHGPAQATDPFSALPFEVRDMILTYLDSDTVPALRLASRSLAAVPLSTFFQSRFWPGRELDLFFDAFILRRDERAQIDWRAFYVRMKRRLRNSEACMGETNRLRIMHDTMRPLAKAMDQVALLSKPRGNPCAEAADSDGGRDSVPCVEVLGLQLNRKPVPRGFQAEVELSRPPKIMHVTFIEFFGKPYIAGIRLGFAEGDDVELGFISRALEHSVPIEGILKGFSAEYTDFGFRSVPGPWPYILSCPLENHFCSHGNFVMTSTSKIHLWSIRLKPSENCAESECMSRDLAPHTKTLSITDEPPQFRVHKKFMFASKGVRKIRATFDVSALWLRHTESNASS